MNLAHAWCRCQTTCSGSLPTIEGSRTQLQLQYCDGSLDEPQRARQLWAHEEGTHAHMHALLYPPCLHTYVVLLAVDVLVAVVLQVVR
jgi:hypothetical protein